MAFDATIVENSAAAQAESVKLMQASNMQTVRLIDFNADANATRPPDYYLYVFNIAPRSFQVRRPPSFPLVTLAKCAVGKPYELVARVPSTVNEKWIDADSGEPRYKGITGERFATDLLNPANLGIDIWQEITDENESWIDHGTDDLTRRGVFWTRNQVPSEEELAQAKSRMERHYRTLIAQAEDLSHDPKRIKEIGREHHAAADYFGLKATWHVIAEAPSFCPNCGEPIKAGLPYHRNSFGDKCVLDWKRTVAAGAAKKEDVPEELRWWTSKKTA